MKPSESVAYVRQLCSLGIASESLMPELLTAVRQAVPSSAAVFFWVDAEFQVSGAHFDFRFDPRRSRLYFQEFYNRRESEFSPGFSAALRRQHEPGGLLRDYLGPRFYRSELYDVIWRPEGLHHSVATTLRDGERCLGVLQLFRAPGERPFSPAEETRAYRFAPYLVHALESPVEKAPAPGPGCETAMLVVDPQGRLLHASPQARRLLFQATFGLLSPATAARRDNVLPEAVRKLVDDLFGLWSGQPRPPAALRLQTRSGVYDFRAYPLHPAGLHEEPRCGLHIEYRRPLAVQLMGAMAALPLSARQRETCLLLVTGHDYNAIASRMGTKRSTTIDQVRKIYDKLDVHGRDELAARLNNAAAVQQSLA